MAGGNCFTEAAPTVSRRAARAAVCVRGVCKQAGDLLCGAAKHTPPASTRTHTNTNSVMLVGWGGNNGTTVTAGVLANKQ